MTRHKRSRIELLGTTLSALITFALPSVTMAQSVKAGDAIRHVVVIYQENVSFDHYFATYPHSMNLPGEPVFTALPGTPTVDGLSSNLLSHNPNATNAENGAGMSNPFRLSRQQAVTADQDHGYRAEQRAFDGGRMDLFPRSVGKPDGPKIPGENAGVSSTSGLTMGYFDGNTVTAYWNYAQRYAMSDRHFDVVFGPSTPGAIDLISGQTNGAVNDQGAEGNLTADGSGGFTMIADPNPTGDLCSSTSDPLVHMTGPNIGDRLSSANVSWGFFQGGFDLTVVNANGTTGCRRSTRTAYQTDKRDYLPHHQPFQYYKSTANPLHRRPSSVKAIGTNADGGADHEYDMHDFFDAVRGGNFPSVSYLKAPAYQDGHSGYSTPLAEQEFVVGVVNFLEQQPEWKHTAVIIAYDDSDGWYDHVMAPTTNGSSAPVDELNGEGQCGRAETALPGVNPASRHANGRCGPGPRLPLLVISPWARPNFVDHTQTDQTSILRFIEDVFLQGQRLGAGSFDATAGSIDGMFDFSNVKPKNLQPLLLDPTTGLRRSEK